MMNGQNPYARFQAGGGMPPAQPQQRMQTQASMGPYSPRVQPRAMQRPTFQSQPTQRPSGGDNGAGMLGGIMSGLSDERSKTEIARLEGQNEALTQALDQSFNGPNTPATEYPKLPQNTRVPPSNASFADSPAANTVAAQNVGLQQGAPAPGRAAGIAQHPDYMKPPVQVQGGFARPNLTTPDMSELDRAYARMGQGG